jgi:hypothetical protein
MSEEIDTNALTMAKLNLQWWINKDKNDPDMDYSQRIQFARFKLERISGQKVKLRK